MNQTAPAYRTSVLASSSQRHTATESMSASLAKTSKSGRQTTGKVFVEKAHLLEDLLITEDASPFTSSSRYHRVEKTRGLPSSSTATRVGASMHNANTRDPLQEMRKQQQGGEDHNPHQEAVEIERERRDRQFPQLLLNVDKAIDAVKGIDRELRLTDEAKFNKTRRQFEEWNTNVHGAIMKKIHENIESVPSKQLNKKKNQDYNKFLSITNRKPCIFRDIIIESEYDPLEPNRQCIKTTTKRLNDPVKVSEIKARQEASMLGSAGGSSTGSNKMLGKDTLDVQLWAAGQIEATPYGTFAKMMNSKNHPQDEKEAATLRSNVHFDHYSFPRGKAAIDAEMPRGKRVHPQMVYSDPGRIFGTLPPEVEREVAAIRPPENRIFG